MSRQCIECGNMGFPDKECPVCHRSATSVIDETTIRDMKKFEKAIDFALIPKNVAGMTFNFNIINDKLSCIQNTTVRFYLNTIKKLDEIFKSGRPLTKSMFISAPPKYAKTTLAYSCMQYAINRGETVAPLIDTIQLRCLLLNTSPRYRLLGKYTLDKYIESDVCFVTVTKTYAFRESLDDIRELLSRRARLGLSTVILSEFPLKEFNRGLCHYSSIVDGANSNDLMYPVIVEVNVDGNK